MPEFRICFDKDFDVAYRIVNFFDRCCLQDIQTSKLEVAWSFFFLSLTIIYPSWKRKRKNRLQLMY